MRVKTYSSCTWLYPDCIIDAEDSSVSIEIAKGGFASFQILTDLTTDEENSISTVWENAFSLKCNVYELLPVCVDQNSGKDVLTGPYEDVKEFATRKAPFYVYDAMRLVDDGRIHKGRCALYITLEADRNIKCGKKQIALTVSLGEESFTVTIDLCVHAAEIPALKNARFGMINWLNTDQMCMQHNVKTSDESFDRLLEAYIDNQIEMRNTQLQLPSGKPVRDEDGRVTGFDFSLAEKVGNKALERGFQYVLGGFVARFKVWDEKTHYLLWDRNVSVQSHEGYRQLKLYFTETAKIISKNGWEGKYMQTLVDEPQFPNSDHYRILSSIARKFLPGVLIHDPVESTLLDGAIDIWDVKQAVFEKYLDEYRMLQDMGEEMWLYTCGFPAGKMMNRVMDLPLTASLLPMWMCYLYDCKGFLHWGYNYHTETPFEKTCYVPEEDHPEIAYPAGNAHIVYPGEKGPLWSVRAMIQRIGAEDYELLSLLGDKHPALSKELIKKVCRNFSDYTFDGSEVDRVRKEILLALDK